MITSTHTVAQPAPAEYGVEALSEDARQFIRSARAEGRRPVQQLSVTDARAQYIMTCQGYGLPPKHLMEVHDTRIATPAGNIAIRVYQPPRNDETEQPVIFFFHGGGWVIGNLDTHDGICRYLAAGTGIMVVAVDYSLSPEVKFPVAVSQCHEVLKAVMSHAGQWNIDSNRVIVAGDSAGGNLATVMTLLNREHRFMNVAAQVLFYPVTDLYNRTGSYERVKEGVTLTADSMNYFTANYLSSPIDARDWRASPLLSPSLSNLPAAFIVTVGHDPLCDEGIYYAEGLRAAGNRVEHLHLPREMHGFLTVGKVMKEATTVLDKSVEFILSSIKFS
ncbi:alpha/beta hydrolase [Oceanimonas sp. MB9]|uniref:alpha/beta hydrolase n=1 Tax=Oceanimonas sp. MB9 TaxID=2588453 RepID=UPI0013F655D9|nr:alpha/beta hydrolase [Oceanimonas sp. MB9]NHI02111.1 Carboxylesterase NlhH [Oceanimonas sp. MB9]